MHTPHIINHLLTNKKKIFISHSSFLLKDNNTNILDSFYMNQLQKK